MPTVNSPRRYHSSDSTSLLKWITFCSGWRFLLYEVVSVGHQSPGEKCRGQTCSSRQIEQQILFHRINCMRARLTWRAVHWASSLPLKGVLLIRCQDLTRHTFYTHTHTLSLLLVPEPSSPLAPVIRTHCFHLVLFMLWSALWYFFPSQENESSQFSQLVAEAGMMNVRSLSASLVIYWTFTRQLFAYSRCKLSRLQGQEEP